MYRILLLLFIGGVTSSFFLNFNRNNELESYRRMDPGQLTVESVLQYLGDEELVHSQPSYDKAKAEMGEDLILDGYTKRNGKKSRKISKHFVCTDCHNMGKEFDVLSSQSPSDRLAYAERNGIPFLPGSTLWGIYNREKFYNDDYVKKYGDLVVDARDSLENAVQLCAKYCASGRYLKDWELEAIMHYFKKNELRLKDLNLDEATMKDVLRHSQLNASEKETLKDKIKSSYRQHYSATFLPTMDVNKRKYGEGGDPERGKKIYDKSCLYCHANKRVTYLNLDKGKLTARMFWRNIENYTDKSLYQIIRYGTYAKSGRKQYMPLYTEEKMSDDQINDLVAYIKQLAGK